MGWGRRAQGHSRQLLQLLTVKGVFDELADAPVRDVVISQAKKDIKKKKIHLKTELMREKKMNKTLEETLAHLQRAIISAFEKCCKA